MTVTGTREVITEYSLVAPSKASIVDVHYGGCGCATARGAAENRCKEGVLRTRRSRRCVQHRRAGNTRLAPSWQG